MIFTANMNNGKPTWGTEDTIKVPPKGFIFNKIRNGIARLDIIYESPVSMERAGTRGISHLLEHVVCDAVKNYENEFDKLGINQNAFTSDAVVSFHIDGLKTDIDSIAKKYIDGIYNADIDEAIFNKEKGIVLREFDMSMSDSNRALIEMLQIHLRGRGYVIGVRKDIEDITIDEIRKFYNEAYGKPSYIVYTCADEPTPELTEYCQGLEYGGNADWAEDTYPDTYYNCRSDKVESITYRYILDLNTSNMVDYFYMPIINSCLGSGLASPLMVELREKRNLTYGAYATATIEENMQKSRMEICCTSSPDSKDEIIKVMQEVIDNYKTYLTQDRFDTIMAAIKKNIEMVEYSMPGYNHVKKHTFRGNERYSMYKNLHKITYEGMMEFFRANIVDGTFKMYDDITIENIMKEKATTTSTAKIATEDFDIDLVNTDFAITIEEFSL